MYNSTFMFITNLRQPSGWQVSGLSDTKLVINYVTSKYFLNTAFFGLTVYILYRLHGTIYIHVCHLV